MVHGLDIYVTSSAEKVITKMASIIPVGYYRAVVENPKIAASTKKDTPCINATVRIVEDGPHKGLRLNWEGWLTENAGKRTIQSLIYAGCTFPEDPETGAPNLEDFTGCGSQEVEVVIEHEEYTPEATEANPKPKTSKRPRVEFINPIGASRATKDVDEGTKKMIASSFGGMISQVKKEQSERRAKKGDDTSFNPAEFGNAEGGEKKKLY
jgi:hypothetical protein